VLLSEGGLRIAYVGPFIEEAKQISLLARAFCDVVKAVPGVSATLYGDGPASESVERILATEGKGLPVKAVGRLDSASLRNALLHTDAMVLLSDFEGLPFSLMQAMGCGCVPVCLRIRNGIPELVVDGVTGMLVNDRGDSFVSAIRRLREDDMMWRRLSDNARLHIEKGYSDEAAATAWINLLSELAEESHPSRIKIPARIRIPAAIPPYEEPDSRKPQDSPILSVFRKLKISLPKLAMFPASKTVSVSRKPSIKSLG
jgi:glycosyltransferase involved in cell wall biosynthesis